MLILAVSMVVLSTCFVIDGASIRQKRQEAYGRSPSYVDPSYNAKNIQAARERFVNKSYDRYLSLLKFGNVDNHINKSNRQSANRLYNNKALAHRLANAEYYASGAGRYRYGGFGSGAGFGGFGGRGAFTGLRGLTRGGDLGPFGSGSVTRLGGSLGREGSYQG